MRKLNDLETEVNDKKTTINNLEGINKKLITDWKKDYEGLAKSFEDLNKAKDRSSSVPPTNKEDKIQSPYEN